MNVNVDLSLDNWIANLSELGGTALVDESRLNASIQQHLRTNSIKVRDHRSSIPLQMSIKSPGEVRASLSAHLLDGVAKTRFLYRLHNSRFNNNDEYQAKLNLDEIRRVSRDYYGPSFPWVSCVGPNAAKPHYKPRSNDCLPINDGSIFLIDSGGQYPGATTDVTRTVYIGDTGRADPEFRNRFTLVLRSFLRAMSCSLPDNTTAAQLDAITRSSMWSNGLDFGHGTGHGVGAGLSIHENPIVISGRANRFKLKPNMIFSIEPGYYERDKWGIRIENLIVISRADYKVNNRRMMTLEPLTLVPIQIELVMKDILAPDEIHWLNQYHRRVIDALSPHLENDEIAWLHSYAREM